MSILSNQGPIKHQPNTNSQHSLYTSNSKDSDDLPQGMQLANQQQKGHSYSKQVGTNPEARLLPTIKQNHVAVGNKDVKLIDDDLVLPHEKQVDHHDKNYATHENDVNNRTHGNGHGFFGLESSKKNGESRYQQYQHQEPQNLPNKSYSISDQKQRMLRSSQGGRWIRSQTLMQQKQQKSPNHMLRNYHKHASMMSSVVERYMKVYLAAEKEIASKPYKISLGDPLEAIKVKIESYLEKKLNLSNVSIDRPDSEWTQKDLTKFFVNYQPVLMNETFENPQHQPLTLKKYKNCVYFGIISHGKKEGKGVLHYYDGKFFEGVFKQDHKVQGVEIDDHEIYYGQFRRGVRHGEGILKTNASLVAGTFFEGEFCLPHSREEVNRSILESTHRSPVPTQQNRKKGIKINFNTITYYDTEFVILKNNTGDIFIGNLNENEEKEGEGLELFANADLYVGKYEAGSPQGYGEYYWESGAFYRGQFLSGMRHGRGKWQMINGDQYEGEYMNDKKTGKGVYTWKNGSKYVGTFENDYRHGYGEMFWQDGRVYKGKWLNGIQRDTVLKLGASSVSKGKHLPNVTKTSFRTIQHQKEGRKNNITLDKLKNIYNPSHIDF